MRACIHAFMEHIQLMWERGNYETRHLQSKPAPPWCRNNHIGGSSMTKNSSNLILGNTWPTFKHHSSLILLRSSSWSAKLLHRGLWLLLTMHALESRFAMHIKSCVYRWSISNLCIPLLVICLLPSSGQGTWPQTHSHQARTRLFPWFVTRISLLASPWNSYL